MRQGDVRGMQLLQSEGGLVFRQFLFYPQLKIISCLHLNGPLVVVLVLETMFMLGHWFFLIFLTINRNEYNKLGGKNPPQIWSNSRKILSGRGAWALCSCSLAECCWSLSFQWRGDRQNQKFCRNYGVLTLELETFISVKKVASTLKSSWAATCSTLQKSWKRCFDGFARVKWLPRESVIEEMKWNCFSKLTIFGSILSG